MKKPFLIFEGFESRDLSAENGARSHGLEVFREFVLSNVLDFVRFGDGEEFAHRWPKLFLPGDEVIFDTGKYYLYKFKKVISSIFQYSKLKREIMKFDNSDTILRKSSHL